MTIQFAILDWKSCISGQGYKIGPVCPSFSTLTVNPFDAQTQCHRVCVIVVRWSFLPRLTRGRCDMRAFSFTSVYLGERKPLRKKGYNNEHPHTCVFCRVAVSGLFYSCKTSWQNYAQDSRLQWSACNNYWSVSNIYCIEPELQPTISNNNDTASNLNSAHYTIAGKSLFGIYMQWFSGNIFATRCCSHMRFSPLVLNCKTVGLVLLEKCTENHCIQLVNWLYTYMGWPNFFQMDFTTLTL